MNNQKPEPAKHDDGLRLDVHSIFGTIQGEGPFIGYPSIFVRLAGCNIQCPGCDTEYTEGRQILSLGYLRDTILEVSKEANYKLIVITGGEPLRQNLGPFLHDLLFMNFKVQIESNGIIAPDGVKPAFIDHRVKLVISPKTSRIHPFLAQSAHAYKYVLQADNIDPEDGLPSIALGHKASPRVARPPKGWIGPIYLNPMDEKDDGKNKRNMQAVLASCMKHGYIAGIQAHKIWELP